MARKTARLLAAAMLSAGIVSGCEHGALTPAPPPNDPPSLETVLVFPDTVVGGSRVALLAGAFDPDGDSLKVHWTVDGGELLPSPGGMLWDPPVKPGAYAARVVVSDPRGESMGRAVSLRVGPPREPNRFPVIDTLSAADGEILPFASTNFTVRATDPDGDGPLGFDWAASGGRVLPQGDLMTWLAPGRQGVYTISCAVTDTMGATSTATAAVRVHVDNSPPEILSVVASEPRVRLGRAVTLSVEATDVDDDDANLSYSWRSGGGEFRGEGPAVEWIAPEGPACCAIGPYEIQVFVSDPRGAASLGLIVVEVVQ